MTNFIEDNTARLCSQAQSHQLPIVFKVATGLTAAGSTSGTALQLTAVINNITTAAASTGVKLPQSLDVGSGAIVVKNLGANAVLVYPPLASQGINALANDAGFSIAAGASASFALVSATKLISY